MKDKQNYLPFQNWFSARVELFKDYICPFCAALFSGMLACMFAMTNALTNFDDVSAMFDKGASLYSGRWGLDYISWLLPDYSMPWFNRIISLLMLCTAACFIVYIFRIHNPILRILVSASIPVFPSFTGEMIYGFMIAPYTLAFLLSVISVYLAEENFRHRRLMRFLAILLSCFAMGIYQAFIAVVSSLFLIVLLRHLLVMNEKPYDVFTRGIRFVLHLVASCVLYYVVMKVLMAVYNTELGDYARWMISNEHSVIKSVAEAYITVFSVFRGAFGLMPTTFARVLNAVIFAALFYELLRYFLRCGSNAARLLELFILLLIPMSVFFMVIITFEKGHTLMYCGFVVFYVLLAVLLEGEIETDASLPWHQRFISGCSLVALSLMVVCYSVAANEAYLRVYLNYENTYSYYTSMLTQIQMTPGFDENSVLCIVGHSEEQRHQFSQFDNQTMIHGTEGVNHNDYSYFNFLHYFIGSDIPLATDEQISAVAAEEEFKAMPIYPYYGSIAKMGDLMVVKLSDIN